MSTRVFNPRTFITISRANQVLQTMPANCFQGKIKRIQTFYAIYADEFLFKLEARYPNELERFKDIADAWFPQIAPAAHQYITHMEQTHS